MDERVGVDELERARGRQRQRAAVLDVGAVRQRDRFGGGERQRRAQPLAAGEQAVAASPRGRAGGQAGAAGR